MTEFCDCEWFVFWYMELTGVSVCQCGHPQSYHIDEARLCTGEVEVSHG